MCAARGENVAMSFTEFRELTNGFLDFGAITAGHQFVVAVFAVSAAPNAEHREAPE